MKYRFAELVDLEEFRALMQDFYETTGIIYGLVDIDGNVLGNIGWRNICARFHRTHPITEQRCLESNKEMLASIREGELCGRRCLNGLYDYATPIIIDGEVVGQMATGQLLHEPPDEEFFRQQARENGFDEVEYMQAVREIPIIPVERVASIMRFYSRLAHLLANNGLLRLRQLEAEAELEAEKERLAVTLRSIGDGVIATDPYGRIVLLNSVAEHLTGWQQQEAAGLPLPEIFHIVNEETHLPCDNPVNIVFETGKIVGLANHTMLIARDGTERIIADSGAPIRDHQGNILGVVLVFRDITMESRLQADLQRSAKMESIGVLAGGIAHDFNNMLTAIAGNVTLAELMIRSNQLPRAQTYLREAETASIRARDLTQQLLTFSRGGAPVKSVLDLTPIIQESARFALSGSHTRCEFKLDNLWTIEADPGQVAQVIHNLVLNADQAMPTSGVITITATNVELRAPGIVPLPAGKYVKIEVADVGVGMSQELMSRIFDPFITTKQRGSGLGLASAYSIIRNHQGHISVRSTLGKGSIFTFYLPALQADFDSCPPAFDTPSAPASLRILLMDDEDQVRMMLSEMLQELGHTVDAVDDGEEAITCYQRQLAAQTGYDLVILDLTIPGGLGGKDTLRRLRELNPNICAVATSGYSTDPVMANYTHYGFVGCLTKPYRLQELHAVLAALQLHNK